MGASKELDFAVAFSLQGTAVLRGQVPFLSPQQTKMLYTGAATE